MISVVIPLYNAKKYICDAVASALCQNVEMEIIVVDDASSDQSAERLVSYLEKKFSCEKKTGDTKEKEPLPDCKLLWNKVLNNTHVCIYRNRKNLGVAITRNRGVMFAEGEYIAFLDADDLWEKGKLKKQLALLEKTGAVLCNTGRKLLYANGKDANVYIGTPKRITLRDLKRTNCINLSSVLMQREVMLEYPMQRGSDIHEDYLTWLCLLRKYKYVVGLDEPLLLYRLSKKGKSRNKLRAARMTYRTYRCAGYGIICSLFMLLPYTYYGMKKYRLKNMF